MIFLLTFYLEHSRAERLFYPCNPRAVTDPHNRRLFSGHSRPKAKGL